MLKLDAYDVPAFGYYLVKLHRNIEVDEGFEMPNESSELATGEIISSGEVVTIGETQFDLEFAEGDVVVFKRHTGFTIKIKLEGESKDSKYKILPYDSVLLKIKEIDEDDE